MPFLLPRRRSEGAATLPDLPEQEERADRTAPVTTVPRQRREQAPTPAPLPRPSPPVLALRRDGACRPRRRPLDGRAVLSGWSDGKIRAFGPQVRQNPPPSLVLSGHAASLTPY